MQLFARNLLALAISGIFVNAAWADKVESVEPELETRAVFDDDEGHNADADDPAIWVHPTDREKSLVIATLKEGGLDVYDLDGELIQHIPGAAAPTEDDNPGRLNNVDLIYGFPLGNRQADIAVASDRGRDQLAVYRIRADYGKKVAPLVDITAPNAPWIFSSSQSEVNAGRTAYGLAVAMPERSGPTYAFVSQNDSTAVAKLALRADRDGRVGYAKVDQFNLQNRYTLPNGTTWQACQDEDGQQAQVEGMVADAQAGWLYLGQEQVGIFKTSLWNPGASITAVDYVQEFGVPYSRTWNAEEEEYECELLPEQDPGFGGKALSADVEGLTLYQAREGRGYLLASSQGTDQMAVYDRRGDNAYIGNFRIEADDGIDSVEETDGAAVMNMSLGDEFDEGLLVVQDGNNTPDETDADGEKRDNSNFKFVEWDDIAEELDLLIDTSNSVRN